MKNRHYTNVKFLDLGFSCRCESPVVWPCFHQHNEIEFMLIKRGQATYRFGGNIHKLEAGSLVCLWSSVPHQIIEVKSGTYFEWVTIPLGRFIQWRMPDKFSSSVMQGKMLVSMNTDLVDQLIFKQWEHDLNLNSKTIRHIVILEVEARLRRFALKLGLENPAALGKKNVPFSTDNLGKIEQINLYIATHYQKKLTITEIAKQVHLHPNYLVSLFRAHCGIGLIDLISKFRILHAQRLLVTTDMKVLTIAFESGFSSAASFYEVFKRICQQTPTQYRTQNSLN